MKKILVFSLLAVSAASFAVEQTGAGFAITDLGTASSQIVLSQGAVSIDYVRLNGTTHTWVGDLIVDVNGTFLMNRTGAAVPGVGDSSNLGGDYTFAAAGSDWWAEAAAGTSAYVMASGTYASSGIGSGAPNGFITGGYAVNTIFTLTISDNAGGDVGALRDWTIGYTAVPEPASMAALGLGVVALIRRRRSK